MPKTDKIENKDQNIEKSNKKAIKSSYSKKKRQKKMFKMVLLMFNLPLITQLFRLQIQMEMLFLGLLQVKKVLKVLESQPHTQHKLLLTQLQQKL